MKWLKQFCFYKFSVKNVDSQVPGHGYGNISITELHMAFLGLIVKNESIVDMCLLVGSLFLPFFYKKGNQV